MPRAARGGRHIRARAAACPANGRVSGHSIRALHGIRVDLNVFGYRSIQSGQFIYNPGTLIQISARFFSPDAVKTGHSHLQRAELCVKRRLCPFSASDFFFIKNSHATCAIFGETSEPIVLARSSQKNTQRVAKPLEAGEKGKKVSHPPHP